MTRYLKALGLSMIAVLALAAVSAASASASQPHFVLETGQSFPAQFTSTGGAGNLETKAGRKIHCSANSSTGTVTSETEAEATVTFTTCHTEGQLINVSCKTAGKNSGEIVTALQKGHLQYIKVKEGTSEREAAGMDLKPASGEVFAEIECGGVQKLWVKGSVVGEIEPVNTGFRNTFTMIFRQSGGIQNPTGYRNPEGCTNVADFLETKGEQTGIGGQTFAYEQSAVEGSTTITTAKNAKIESSSCV